MEFKETKEFLKSIHGNNQINFNCIRQGELALKANGQFNEHIINSLLQLNEQNHEIYFVVNSGGYKDKDIIQFNAVFVDFDCGKDENDRYHSLDVVQRFKEQKLSEINAFSAKPSYIIDTRNGFHVYWLLYPGATREEFILCEESLIQYFQADKSVKKLCQLMRVPGFYWTKYPDNRYLCTVIEKNNVRYQINEILKILPEVNIVNNKKHENAAFKKGNNKNKNISIIPPFEQINYIKNQDIKHLQDIISPEAVSVRSHNEVYDYLKRQDLWLYLGKESNRFRCIIHNDSNPSAGILQNPENGHYIYNCLSDNCGFKGTIIELTEKITGLNRKETLRFLRKVYRIEYEETEWQLEQKKILEHNIGLNPYV